MRYLVDLIKEKRPDADDSTIEYIISFFIKEGYISYTVQYHYDIYQFYVKAVEHYASIGLKKKCALIDTQDHFKIKRSHLYNIIRNFSK